jgi:glutamate racemase
MGNDQPLGVFDSGLGGISVLREIRTVLPRESVIYFADNAYCPYGLRSPEEIRERSRSATGHLISQGAKAVVVACNTASSMAIDDLRETFHPTPIIGLEPAVKPAVARTRTGNVGVLATPRTVAGERLRWLIETHAEGVTVHTVAAPGLVELVESGILIGPDVVAALQPLLDPMITAGVDVIVLGCTHYPFLRDAIAAYVGPGVAIIDSGAAIANRARWVLTGSGLLQPFAPGWSSTLQFETSATVEEIAPVVELLLGERAPVRHASLGDTASVDPGLTTAAM